VFYRGKYIYFYICIRVYDFIRDIRDMIKRASEYHKLYYTQRWKKLRRYQLDKQPLCGYCQHLGVTELATVVDHIKPHKGDEVLFYDDKNLQSLCKRCHDSVKAIEESRGVIMGNGLDGFPIDKNHPWYK